MLVLATAALLAGCGDGTVSEPRTRIDPAKTLAILPTPQGFPQSTAVSPLDAAGLQAVLAGVAKEEAAQVYRDIGFYDAAVRTWSAPDGARMIAIVSRWPDHETAGRVGGGAVNQVIDDAGAAAWTPRELSGARGARLSATESAPIKVLSFAVGDANLFVRGDGEVSDAAVVRTMELLSKPVRAATPR